MNKGWGWDFGVGKMGGWKREGMWWKKVGKRVFFGVGGFSCGFIAVLPFLVTEE